LNILGHIITSVYGVPYFFMSL